MPKEAGQKYSEKNNPGKFAMKRTLVDSTKKELRSLDSFQEEEIENISQENENLIEMLNDDWIWEEGSAEVATAERNVLHNRLARNYAGMLVLDTKWYGKGSDEMAYVQDQVKQLFTLLDTPFSKMNKAFSKLGTREEQVSALITRFDEAIRACRSYEEEKNPHFSTGKHRKKIVRNLRLLMEQQKETFLRFVPAWFGGELEEEQQYMQFATLQDLLLRGRGIDVPEHNQLKEQKDYAKDFNNRYGQFLYYADENKQTKLLQDRIFDWKEVKETGKERIVNSNAFDRQSGKANRIQVRVSKQDVRAIEQILGEIVNARFSSEDLTDIRSILSPYKYAKSIQLFRLVRNFTSSNRDLLLVYSEMMKDKDLQCRLNEEDFQKAKEKIEDIKMAENMVRDLESLIDNPRFDVKQFQELISKMSLEEAREAISKYDEGVPGDQAIAYYNKLLRFHKDMDRKAVFSDKEEKEEQPKWSRLETLPYDEAALVEENKKIASELEHWRCFTDMFAGYEWADLKRRLNRNRILMLFHDKRSHSADSTEMTTVKKAIKKLDEAIHLPMEVNGVDTVKTAYKNAIEALQKYENAKKPRSTEGKRRLDRVKELKDALIEERKFISDEVKNKEGSMPTSVQCVNDLLSGLSRKAVKKEGKDRESRLDQFAEQNATIFGSLRDDAGVLPKGVQPIRDAYRELLSMLQLDVSKVTGMHVAMKHRFGQQREATESCFRDLFTKCSEFLAGCKIGEMSERDQRIYEKIKDFSNRIYRIHDNFWIRAEAISKDEIEETSCLDIVDMALEGMEKEAVFEKKIEKTVQEAGQGKEIEKFSSLLTDINEVARAKGGCRYEELADLPGKKSVKVLDNKESREELIRLRIEVNLRIKDEYDRLVMNPVPKAFLKKETDDPMDSKLRHQFAVLMLSLDPEVERLEEFTALSNQVAIKDQGQSFLEEYDEKAKAMDPVIKEKMTAGGNIGMEASLYESNVEGLNQEAVKNFAKVKDAYRLQLGKKRLSDHIDAEYLRYKESDFVDAEAAYNEMKQKLAEIIDTAKKEAPKTGDPETEIPENQIKTETEKEIKTGDPETEIKTETEKKIETGDPETEIKTETEKKIETGDPETEVPVNQIKTETEKKVETEVPETEIKTETEKKVETGDPETEIKTETEKKIETGDPETEIKTETEKKIETGDPETEIKTETEKKIETGDPETEIKTETEKKIETGDPETEIKTETEKKVEKKVKTSSYKVITEDAFKKVSLPKATSNHKIKLNIDHKVYPPTQDSNGCWAAVMTGMFNYVTGKKIGDEKALSIKKIRNAKIDFRDTKGIAGYNGLGLASLNPAAQALIHKHTKFNGTLDYAGIETKCKKNKAGLPREVIKEIRDYVQSVKDLEADLEAQIQAVHDFKDENGAHNYGNIFMMSDIMLDKFAEEGKQTGMKLTVFNAVNRLVTEKITETDSMGNKKETYKITDRQIKDAEPDIISYKNQILDVIADSLGKNVPVGYLYDGHYVMITGINGEKLDYIHSLSSYGIFRSNKGTIDLDEILKNVKDNLIELTALEPIGASREAMMKEFKNLQIDEKGNVSAKGKEDLMFMEDQIAHTKGVRITNSASDENDNRDDVYYGQTLYFPKKISFK